MDPKWGNTPRESVSLTAAQEAEADTAALATDPGRAGWGSWAGPGWRVQLLRNKVPPALRWVVGTQRAAPSFTPIEQEVWLVGNLPVGIRFLRELKHLWAYF